MIIGIKEYPEFEMNNIDFPFDYKGERYISVEGAYNELKNGENEDPELLFYLAYNRIKQNVGLRRKLDNTFGKISYSYENDIYWEYWHSRILN